MNKSILQNFQSGASSWMIINTNNNPEKIKETFITIYDFFQILGFLNFFLWASDLWFIYKETEWFQAKQPAAAASPTV